MRFLCIIRMTHFFFFVKFCFLNVRLGSYTENKVFVKFFPFLNKTIKLFNKKKQINKIEI